jgi:hypothetical protein
MCPHVEENNERCKQEKKRTYSSGFSPFGEFNEEQG